MQLFSLPALIFEMLVVQNEKERKKKKNLPPPSVIPQDYIYSCHTVADPAMEWTW